MMTRKIASVVTVVAMSLALSAGPLWPGRRLDSGALPLERLHPGWKIIAIRRAAPASCLQSICISLKPPAHEGRFQSG
jgi:hypothetical protein